MDIITIGIPSVIMILSYGIIWWFAWKNGKYLKRIGHDDLKKVISKRENQTTKTLFMVCLSYLLFVAPISLADTQELLEKHPLWDLLLRILYYLQYSLNFFIYAAKSEQYRQAYEYFYKTCMRRQTKVTVHQLFYNVVASLARISRDPRDDSQVPRNPWILENHETKHADFTGISSSS